MSPAGPSPEGEISESVREELHRLARASLLAAARGEPLPTPSREGILGEPRALFVSLHLGGLLRGCIGTIKPVRSLGESVVEMSRSASQYDPRFPPVREEEVGSLEVDISVLTPFEDVEDPATIEVGRDGLYITGRGRSGLLLPQVPTQFGWDRETYLEHTCQKAGLPPGAWKDADVRLQRFRAEVF